MDWSLVLASQDIPSTIIKSESGWALEVEPSDHQAALRAIQQFRVENRGWNWRQPAAWSATMFHWGALGWCILLILVYRVTSLDYPEFKTAAQFATREVARGEWWRAFTATLLHADLGHLLANTTSGVLLFGLAMARYGSGLGLFSAYLSGAIGNWIACTLYPGDYTGLGASGMVMGALALIFVPTLHRGQWNRQRRQSALRSALGGVFLFVLLGVNPASDVLTHAAGFFAGAVIGVLLNMIPDRYRDSTWVKATALLGLAALLLWPIWLACSTISTTAPPSQATSRLLQPHE